MVYLLISVNRLLPGQLSGYAAGQGISGETSCGHSLRLEPGHFVTCHVPMWDLMCTFC